MGGLRIDGKAVTDVQNRLASGLRIDGKAPQAEIAAPAPAAPNKTAEAASKAAAGDKKSVSERFAETMLRRLEDAQISKDEEDRKSTEENKALVESLTLAVDELKNQFGQEYANETMAKILTNTEKDVTQTRIANAFSGVLKGINLVNEREEDALKQESMQGKLEEFVSFLNQDIAIEGGEDESSVQGLSAALTTYFDPAVTGTPKKGFDENFKWGELKADTEENEWSLKLNAAPPERVSFDEYKAMNAGVKGQGITVGEFGRENLADFADYLRNTVKSEEAAQFIENLEDGDDLLDAAEWLVENVGGMEITPDVNELWQCTNLNGERIDVAQLPLILVNGEPPPGDPYKAHTNVQFYVTNNFVDQINEAILGSEELQERFGGQVFKGWKGGLEKQRFFDPVADTWITPPDQPPFSALRVWGDFDPKHPSLAAGYNQANQKTFERLRQAGYEVDESQFKYGLLGVVSIEDFAYQHNLARSTNHTPNGSMVDNWA